MNKGEFENLLISELRVFPISIVTEELTDENIIKAVTINEELKNIGYTLKPKDIVSLAKSNRIDTLYNDIKSHIGDVKAEPMYPNFPSQVMEISEAEFRFHQLVHYFSTYGMENIFGVSVNKGWLPNVENTDKTVEDTTLLSAKVLELIIETEHYSIFEYVYNKVLSKRERITDKEKMLLSECLPHLSLMPEKLIIDIPFKQNILDVFYTIFNSDIDNWTKINAFKGICKHTGDVWKCIDYTLTKCKYHFKTSQKRMLVKLLESYPLNDFENNLAITNKKGDRVILLLQYLDYNKYSRKQGHKSAVASLRNSELTTWNSTVERLISIKSIKALDEIAKRPGNAIRMITKLLRNGFEVEDIYNALKNKAEELNTQTLVTLCTKFGKFESEQDTVKATEMLNVYTICFRLLRDKFSKITTPLKDKKVYIDMSEYNLDYSIIQTNDKSSEGGYIRSGIAYSVPENVNYARFFVYWNDKVRVDIDLHSSAKDKDGTFVDLGWNTNFKDTNLGVVTSGDITHSDAAEYIDVDLNNKNIDSIFFNINIYTIQKPCEHTFNNIEECYVGCMAVDNVGTNVALYNPKNCFFTHYLTSKCSTLNYGFLDVSKRYIKFTGTSTNNTYLRENDNISVFNINRFITLLGIGQNITFVDNKDDADNILVMAKPMNDKEISLIDNNFFMDC